MSKPTDFIRAVVRLGRARYSVAALSVLMLAVAARAQTGGTEGFTPSTMTPGAPAGSYALSGFDNINLFNGKLNFALPLLRVGGRGEAQYTMTLPIEAHWRVLHFTTLHNCGQQGCTPQHFYSADNSWWPLLEPGYGPGVLLARKVGDSPVTIEGCTYYTRTLTRLTFTGPGGTEFELRDALTNGQPLQNLCNLGTGPSRGTIFKTADGTSATFVSDSIIRDSQSVGPAVQATVSGILMLRNGVRYRISGGRVDWIRDRNGNKLTFTYGSSGVHTIVDSLGRVITINYNLLDAFGRYDEIRFPGFAGAQRTIKVRYNSLGGTFPDGATVLRPTESLQTPLQLFPAVRNSGNSTNVNPTLATSVVLPDGRQYRFRYNKYTELWRVELPTGGAVEYEYGSGAGDSTGVYGSGDINTGGEMGIFRRTTERRVYADGGTTPEVRTFYTVEGTKVIVDNQDAVGSLGREEHVFFGSPLVSAFSVPTSDNPWRNGKESSVRIFDKLNGPMLRRVDNTWNQTPPSWYTQPPDGAPANNPVLTDVETKLTDVTPNLVAKEHYAYDQFFNPIIKEEYDFGANAPGALLRVTETLYVDLPGYTNPNSNSGNTDAHLRNLPSIVTIKNGSGLRQAEMTFEYDNYNFDATHAPLVFRAGISGMDPAYQNTSVIKRGNATKTSRWLDTTGGALDTYSQYDIAGNVVKNIDARGNANLLDYSSAFQYAFPTQMTTPVPDSSGANGSSTPLTMLANYDFSTGLVISITDANGQITSAEYNDLLDRLTRVNRPTGGGSTSYFYGDSPGNLFLRTETARVGTQTVATEQVFDGLGRPIRTRSFVPEGTILTIQSYDAMGRIRQATNPHITTTEDTYGTTETTYDGLSRVTMVQTFDKNSSSTGTLLTAYSGNQVTVTDQAGKKRRSTTDGRGRLKQVDEFNLDGTLYASTTYQYDTMDNLILVTQGGQQRAFRYDSLNRLIRGKNPEQAINGALTLTDGTQWCMGYLYDNNSNLAERTDPRNIKTINTYDRLNRVTSRTYQNDPSATPSVSFYYDQALPPGAPSFVLGASRGRLVAVTYGGAGSISGSYQGYDAMGRVSVSRQVTDGFTYSMSYEYDLASNITSETYPSNRLVRYEYDTAGRLAGVKKPDGTYHAGAAESDTLNRIQYTPPGAVSKLRLGNGKWDHAKYNSRLQPIEIGLGANGTDSGILKLEYGYGATNNNGNILSQTITINNGAVINQSYTYDGLNRLGAAQENNGISWRQEFVYDRWGNRNFNVGATTPNVLGPNPTIDTQTNRYASGQGYLYDFAGNMKNEPGKSYDFDAESRQIRFNSGAATYGYDGGGHRVKKVDGTGTTIFVYNSAGLLVAEYKSDPVPPPAGGGGTSYLTTDHLGSTRVVTRADGSVKARYDYLPFGEEIGAGVGARTTVQGYNQADSTKQRFTSKERDGESGLDYFLARYYSSSLGRFTSPDEFTGGPQEVVTLGSGDKENQALPYADITDPRSLNKYQYVLNNPLKYIDPDGHQDSFHARFEAIHKKRLNGEISEKEYWRQLRGPAVGAVAGFVVVGGAMVAIRSPQIAYGIYLWAARNPDKVQQIAAALQEAGGGPPGTITGLENLAKSEKAIIPLINKLADEGKSIKVIITAASQGLKGRSADIIVDGVKVEAKVLEGVAGQATAGTVKNAIARGVGQSSNIIVDARNVTLSLEEAKAGAAIVFEKDSRLKVVRIIGRGFDITIFRE